jgi:hypothetical protein
VRSESVPLEVEFDSAEDYRDFMHAIAAPIHGLLAERPPEQAKAVWEGITEAARDFERDGGKVVMPGEAVCVAARRSG